MVNNTNYDPLFNIDLYNSTSGKWTSKSFNTPRVYQSEATVGNFGFFAGGLALDNQPEGPTDMTSVYDLNSNSWSTLYLPEARSQFAATTVGNQAMFGGGVTIAGVITDTVNVFTLKA